VTVTVSPVPPIAVTALPQHDNKTEKEKNKKKKKKDVILDRPASHGRTPNKSPDYL
jgi:hypothetical protein